MAVHISDSNRNGSQDSVDSLRSSVSVEASSTLSTQTSRCMQDPMIQSEGRSANITSGVDTQTSSNAELSSEQRKHQTSGQYNESYNSRYPSVDTDSPTGSDDSIDSPQDPSGRITSLVSMGSNNSMRSAGSFVIAMGDDNSSSDLGLGSSSGSSDRSLLQRLGLSRSDLVSVQGLPSEESTADETPRPMSSEQIRIAGPSTHIDIVSEISPVRNSTVSSGKYFRESVIISIIYRMEDRGVCPPT